MTSIEQLKIERREKLERQARAIGYDLNYSPEVLMEDIRLLPDSFWHENRMKGWGGSNEGVLNGLSKYSSLPEAVNEKILGNKAPVDDDKQFIFDFGHALEWVMLKRYAALNGYKYLCYKDYYVLVRSDKDVSLSDRRFRKAQKDLYSYVTRNREEAETVLSEISWIYPDSFIMEQESNDPKDVRDITPEEHAMYDSKGIVCVDRRQYVNPNYPSMIGDMDGLCLCPDGTRRGLECKTYTHKAPRGCFTSGVLGESGTIKNEEYHYQVQHYMAVCNLDRFDILACCGNTPDDFTVTTVYRDVDFEKYLCENAQECWERYVENLEEVKVAEISEEAHKSLIRSMTPQEVHDEMVEVPSALAANLEKIEKIQERLKTKKDEISQLEEQIRILQLPIEEVLAGNTGGYIITDQDYDYEVKFVPSAGRSSFDQKRLKIEYPDIYEKYRLSARPGERKFSFCRTGKRIEQEQAS